MKLGMTNCLVSLTTTEKLQAYPKSQKLCLATCFLAPQSSRPEGTQELSWHRYLRWNWNKLSNFETDSEKWLRQISMLLVCVSQTCYQNFYYYYHC